MGPGPAVPARPCPVVGHGEPPHPHRPLASSGDDVEGDLESAGRIGVDRQEVGRGLVPNAPGGRLSLD